jgi:hypothetical protein
MMRFAPDGAGDGGNPPAGGKGDAGAKGDPKPGDGKGDDDPIDLKEWLKGQSEAVRAAFEKDTAGLKSALQSERDARKALEKVETDRKKAADEAERKRLEEQGKFEELAKAARAEADAAQQKLGELEPLTERVKGLEAVLKGYLDKEREGLPKHVLALLDKLDVVDQLEWISQNRAVLAPPPGKGIPSTPGAGGKGDPGNLNDEERRKRSWRPRF